MQRLIPRWFAAMILASLAIIGYGLSQPAAPPSAAPSYEVAQNELIDVMWLDKAPEKPHDPWRAYIFTNENIGLSIDAKSAYKLLIELFEFRADAKKITFHFPHDFRRAQVNYKIEKLKRPTKYFDTQLTIENDPQNGGQTSIYYTGPDFRSASSLPQMLQDSLRSRHLLEYLPE